MHCDNFAMWDSRVNPWNAVRMGPHRDITGELAQAIKKRGREANPFFRLMGVEAYGLVGLYTTILALVVPLDFGLSTTLNREFARASAGGSGGG